MGKTFQEQLLELGLVNKKQVSQAKKAKHTASKKKPKKDRKSPDDENAHLARQAAEKRKARDLELNRQRDAKLQKRADAAAIRQLIA